MQTIPLWLQAAFSDWVTGRLYLDGRGNYRSRVHARRIVRYSRALRRLYLDNRDFCQAADLWLTLWSAVPRARLVRSESPRRSS
jgi:hypothetical protein